MSTGSTSLFSQPMLASDYSSEASYDTDFWLASEKLDGIRCCIQDAYCNKAKAYEKVFSRSGKRIPNHYIRNVLSSLPAGIDGELAPIKANLHAKDAFQQATSAVMTMEGEPANWCYYVFDFFGRPDLPKKERLQIAGSIISDWQKLNPSFAHFVQMLDFEELTIEQALTKAQQIVKDGGEGLMIANPLGQYVHRRARHTESLLLKLKPAQDDEAVIIGFQEAVYTGLTSVLKAMPGYENVKPAEAKRLLAANSELAESCENKIGQGKGELGSIQVKAAGWAESFSIGSGFSKSQREAIWLNTQYYLGRTVRFKYISAGTKDRPRLPIFQGFREEEDLIEIKLKELRHEAAMAKALQLSEKAVASLASDMYSNRIKSSLRSKWPKPSSLQKWVDAGNAEELVTAHISYWTKKGYGI